MNDALRMFDPSASLRLKAGHSAEANAASTGGIAITEEGIIVRGDFLLSSRIAPVVDIRETVDETAFTALESWIPGGRLERLLWSWVEFNGPFAWGGDVKTLLSLHEFILPKPAGITNRSQICLRISGPAIMPNGGAITVAGGTTCQVPALHTVTSRRPGGNQSWCPSGIPTSPRMLSSRTLWPDTSACRVTPYLTRRP